MVDRTRFRIPRRLAIFVWLHLIVVTLALQVQVANGQNDPFANTATVTATETLSTSETLTADTITTSVSARETPSVDVTESLEVTVSKTLPIRPAVITRSSPATIPSSCLTTDADTSYAATCRTVVFQMKNDGFLYTGMRLSSIMRTTVLEPVAPEPRETPFGLVALWDQIGREAAVTSNITHLFVAFPPYVGLEVMRPTVIRFHFGRAAAVTLRGQPVQHPSTLSVTMFPDSFPAASTRGLAVQGMAGVVGWATLFLPVAPVLVDIQAAVLIEISTCTQASSRSVATNGRRILAPTLNDEDSWADALWHAPAFFAVFFAAHYAAGFGTTLWIPRGARHQASVMSVVLFPSLSLGIGLALTAGVASAAIGAFNGAFDENAALVPSPFVGLAVSTASPNAAAPDASGSASSSAGNGSGGEPAAASPATGLVYEDNTPSTVVTRVLAVVGCLFTVSMLGLLLVLALRMYRGKYVALSVSANDFPQLVRFVLPSGAWGPNRHCHNFAVPIAPMRELTVRYATVPWAFASAVAVVFAIPPTSPGGCAAESIVGAALCFTCAGWLLYIRPFRVTNGNIAAAVNVALLAVPMLLSFAHALDPDTTTGTDVGNLFLAVKAIACARGLAQIISVVVEYYALRGELFGSENAKLITSSDESTDEEEVIASPSQQAVYTTAARRRSTATPREMATIAVPGLGQAQDDSMVPLLVVEGSDAHEVTNHAVDDLMISLGPDVGLPALNPSQRQHGRRERGSNSNSMGGSTGSHANSNNNNAGENGEGEGEMDSDARRAHRAKERRRQQRRRKRRQQEQERQRHSLMAALNLPTVLDRLLDDVPMTESESSLLSSSSKSMDSDERFIAQFSDRMTFDDYEALRRRGAAARPPDFATEADLEEDRRREKERRDKLRFRLKAQELFEPPTLSTQPTPQHSTQQHTQTSHHHHHNHQGAAVLPPRQQRRRTSFVNVRDDDEDRGRDAGGAGRRPSNGGGAVGGTSSGPVGVSQWVDDQVFEFSPNHSPRPRTDGGGDRTDDHNNSGSTQQQRQQTTVSGRARSSTAPPMKAADFGTDPDTHEPVVDERSGVKPPSVDNSSFRSDVDALLDTVLGRRRGSGLSQSQSQHKGSSRRVSTGRPSQNQSRRLRGASAASNSASAAPPPPLRENVVHRYLSAAEVDAEAERLLAATTATWQGTHDTVTYTPPSTNGGRGHEGRHDGGGNVTPRRAAAARANDRSRQNRQSPPTGAGPNGESVFGGAWGALLDGEEKAARADAHSGVNADDFDFVDPAFANGEQTENDAAAQQKASAPMAALSALPGKSLQRAKNFLAAGRQKSLTFMASSPPIFDEAFRANAAERMGFGSQSRDPNRAQKNSEHGENTEPQSSVGRSRGRRNRSRRRSAGDEKNSSGTGSSFYDSTGSFDRRPIIDGQPHNGINDDDDDDLFFGRNAGTRGDGAGDAPKEGRLPASHAVARRQSFVGGPGEGSKKRYYLGKPPPLPPSTVPPPKQLPTRLAVSRAEGRLLPPSLAAKMEWEQQLL